MNLTPLVQMSNRYGANPAYVLAGGGNTSCKDGDTMYVKCSGTRLSSITEEGFVPVSRAALRATMDKAYPASDKEREAAFLADVQASRLLPGETRRPSVEALLHALFPQRYVLHLHPAKLNGLTCSQEGEAAMRCLFGSEVVWIPICRPGYILGTLCRDAMGVFRRETGRDANAILLQNHGVFLAADTVEEIDRLFAWIYEKVAARAERSPDMTPCAVASPEALAAVREATGFACAVHCGVREAVRISESRSAASVLLTPFTPDHIVVCGAFPAYAEDISQLSDAAGKRFVLVKKLGFFALGDSESAAETVKSLVLDAMQIAAVSEVFGGPLHMTPDMVDFITHWEAESYRRKKL